MPLIDGSFVVWRVHHDRMSRQRQQSQKSTTDVPAEEEKDNEEIPPGRECFSPSAPTIETINIDTPAAQPCNPENDTPLPPPQTPSTQIAKPPLPVIYSKCVPRFYSVVWTGGTNKGVNGEYLLPDLDYPGRVLVSETTFHAWQNHIQKQYAQAE